MYKNKIIPYLLTITSLSASGTVILDTNPFNESREGVELSPIMVPQLPMRVKRDSGTPPSRPETYQTSDYINRDAFIKHLCEELLSEDAAAKINCERYTFWANFFVVCSSLSTAFILVITIIGASKYIDPSISNVLASVTAAGNAVFLWANVQCKKMVASAMETRKKVQSRFVPPQFVLPLASTSFEPFIK